MFVGRQRELAQLDLLLDPLPAGPTPVEIVGEPGIGKSRLLHEIGEHAAGRGLTVLAGRAGEFERDLPFGVFLDALDHHLAALSEQRAAALGPGHLRWLATAFPGLAERVPPGPPPQAAERYLLHRAVAAALDALAGPTGLVLALDDLHWADESTAELLAHLLRRPPASRLLLLLAHRPRQLPDKLAAVLAGPAYATRHRIELAPLDFAAAQQLLPAHPERRRLYDLAGGNPLYLQVLAHGGELAAPAEQGAEVPPGVAALLRGEFARLAPAARLVAQAAAVIGDQVDPELVAAAAGLSLPETHAAAEELFEADLLRGTGAGQRVTFRHPLLRNAVYHSATPLWRAAAHGRAAALLTERGAALTTIAPHIARSAAVGDTAAVDLLRAAARLALAQAPATAVSWLRVALHGHPTPADDLGRDLRLELAHALMLRGDYRECWDILRGQLDAAPTGQPHLRHQAVVLCATTSRLLCHPEEGRRLLREELARDYPRADADTATLWLHLSLSQVLDARFPEAAEAATAALRLTLPDPLRCIALAMIAWSYPELGRVPEAVAAMDEAVAVYEGLDEPQHLAHLGFTHITPLVEAICHLRLGETLRRLGQVRRMSERLGHLTFGGEVLGTTATVLAHAGRMAEATAQAEEALDAARLTGIEPLLVNVLCARAAVALYCLDLDAAERAGREVAALSCASWHPLAPHLSLLRDLVRARLGLDAPLAETIDRLGGPDLPGTLHRARVLTYLELAHIATDADRPAEAADWATRAESLVQPQLPWSTAAATLARAYAESRTPDPAHARALAEQAAAAFATAGFPVQSARATLLCGQLHATLGDRDQALSTMDTAAAVFADCGATRHTEIVLRHQRRLGRRVPRATKDSPLGLTPRETEIAALVAQGHSNRAVATLLVVSERTVETHLSRIFQKLGLSSRTALAALLARDSFRP
ncbi:helix-turn-helix transcriptional regulator [Crossiella sp. CA198]|uniref:helix-turn-helix transcriptional regulator n=1 Tax=Crossiella sp. CA198 TaxID=3455607 RepID=UPI003F8D560E